RHTISKRDWSSDVCSSDLQFSFAESGNYTFENLEEIIVYLAAINEEEGVVDDIEEVDINTEEPKLDEEELEDIDTESIKNILQEDWELEDMKITDVWEEGVTGSKKLLNTSDQKTSLQQPIKNIVI